MSNQSNQLIIDDRSELHNSDDEQQAREDEEPLNIVPISQRTTDAASAQENPTTTSPKTLSNGQQSSAREPVVTKASVDSESVLYLLKGDLCGATVGRHSTVNKK